MKNTVLLADDNNAIRKVVCRKLEKAGYQVILANNKIQALRTFELVNPDLLITDVVMPKAEEGIELLNIIKERDESFPVIIFTGYDFSEKSLNGRADDYIQKSEPGSRALNQVIFSIRKIFEYSNYGQHIHKKREVGVSPSGRELTEKHLIPINPYKQELYTDVPLYTINGDGNVLLCKKRKLSLHDININEDLIHRIYFSLKDRGTVIALEQDKNKDDLEESVKLNDMSAIHKILVNSAYNIFHSTNKDNVEKMRNMIDILIDGCANDIYKLYKPFGRLDYNTLTHSINVMTLAINFCVKNRGDFTNDDDFHKSSQELGFCGLLHDIGCIKIDNEILTSQKKLTKEQFEKYQLHPFHATAIMKEIGNFNEKLSMGIEEHHERLDGKGFPKKKKKLSHYGKIIGLIDSYEHLTGEWQLFHENRKPLDALGKIKNDVSKGKFDNDLFTKFVLSLKGLRIKD